jgi:hypothetical protein
MKITIEFDPAEWAKGAAQTVSVAPGPAGAAAPMAASHLAAATAPVGAIDAGPGPGAAAVATSAAISEIPAELATQAAAIGAISAGPAPSLD